MITNGMGIDLKEDNLLKKLKEEVIDRGAQYCLPSKLSDFWLDAALKGFEEEDFSLALALVIAILLEKTDSKDTFIPEEKMIKHMEDLKLELTLETISRKTDIVCDAATLETIFTDRSVTFDRDESRLSSQA